MTNEILTILILALFVCLMPIAKSGYTKIQYRQMPQQITAIANCKIQSNAIYTTSDGNLNHWKSYEKTVQYSLQGQSFNHQLVCSKYGSNLDNAYVGVLDAQGRFNLFQEKVGSFTNQIDTVSFNPVRAGAISQISIGKYNLALLYQSASNNIIDVYELPNKGFLTFNISEQVKSMKVDSLGNLAYISQNNKTMLFVYCISPRFSINCIHTLLPQTFNQSPISIDYSQLQNEQYKLRFIVSCLQQAGQIRFSQPSRLSTYVYLGHTVNSQQICDGQRTYFDGNNIIKDTDGQILTIDQPIYMFACTTDTGSYVYSQFYIVSRGNGMNYIDCYYDVNEVLNFFIGSGIFCCCFCLRICASCNQSGCRFLGAIVYALYYVLLWCPTRDNLEQIEDSLQK